MQNQARQLMEFKIKQIIQFCFNKNWKNKEKCQKWRLHSEGKFDILWFLKKSCWKNITNICSCCRYKQRFLVFIALISFILNIYLLFCVNFLYSGVSFPSMCVNLSRVNIECHNKHEWQFSMEGMRSVQSCCIFYRFNQVFTVFIAFSVYRTWKRPLNGRKILVCKRAL